MNVLKHVCRISLCITRQLSNLSTQTSSFHPTLQTFPLFPPASIFKFYNVPSSAAGLWTSPLLHPTANHAVNGRDSTRRSLSRTKKQKHAESCLCCGLYACSGSLVDEQPRLLWQHIHHLRIWWNASGAESGFTAILPDFLIITCSSFMDRLFCCRETSQYSLATTTYSFTYNFIPLFFFFTSFLKFFQNVRDP